jgi:ABC-type transporter Mla subunit MlaD
LQDAERRQLKDIIRKKKNGAEETPAGELEAPGKSAALLPPPSEQAAAVFDRKCRELVRGRTMIQLTLEVRREQNVSVYHEDDQVRINTTLLGDTSVEIVAGHGSPLEPGSQRILLGVSGDFFSNLARSVEQVKDILATVSEVIGPEERRCIQRALRRFDPITRNIEGLTVTVNDRLPKTWDKLDALADQTHKDLEQLGKTIRELDPLLRKTLADADGAILDLQKRVGALADGAGEAVGDVRARLRPILDNVRVLTDGAKTDVPKLLQNAGDLAQRLKTSADRLDGVLGGADRLLGESYGDLRRMVVAFRMSAENFEDCTALLKRRPWLIYNKPNEPKDFENAREMATKLEKATASFRDLSVQLGALRQTLPDQANQEALARMDFLIRELNGLSEALQTAGDHIRKVELPPFVRKQKAFRDNPEDYDPIEAERELRELQRLRKSGPKPE